MNVAISNQQEGKDEYTLPENNYPLSFFQERVWFMEDKEGNGHKHLAAFGQITGTLDVEALQNAFSHVVNGHQILRTIFKHHEGAPFQVPLAKRDWSFKVLDFSRACFSEIKHFVVREAKRPFKLDKDPAIRAILVKGAEDCYYFSVAMHPLVADRSSMGIFYDELIRSYGDLTSGKMDDHFLPHQSFADHVVQVRENGVSNSLSPALDYWRNQLNGYKAQFVRQDSTTEEKKKCTTYAVVNYRLSDEVSDGISSQCVRHDVDRFAYLLAAYKVFLFKQTGKKDTVVGSPFENREHASHQNLIGPLANILPIRTIIDPAKSFLNFTSTLQETLSEAQAHQHVPYERIASMVECDCLLQSKFVFQDISKVNLKEHAGIRFEWEMSPVENADFELTFTVVQEPEGLRVYAAYCTESYHEATIYQWLRQFESLLKGLTQQPDGAIAELKVAVEKQESKSRNPYLSKPNPFQNEVELVPLAAV